MAGFVFYDYGNTFPGWSMSGFMIGKQFQRKGYGKIESYNHIGELARIENETTTSKEIRAANH